MKVSDTIQVEIDDNTTVDGIISSIISDTKFAADLDTDHLYGFNKNTPIRLTKRKDGNYHRQGVETGRGWRLV